MTDLVGDLEDRRRQVRGGELQADILRVVEHRGHRQLERVPRLADDFRREPVWCVQHEGPGQRQTSASCGPRPGTPLSAASPPNHLNHSATEGARGRQRLYGATALIHQYQQAQKYFQDFADEYGLGHVESVLALLTRPQQSIDRQTTHLRERQRGADGGSRSTQWAAVARRRDAANSEMHLPATS